MSRCVDEEQQRSVVIFSFEHLLRLTLRPRSNLHLYPRERLRVAREFASVPSSRATGAARAHKRTDDYDRRRFLRLECGI